MLIFCSASVYQCEENTIKLGLFSINNTYLFVYSTHLFNLKRYSFLFFCICVCVCEWMCVTYVSQRVCICMSVSVCVFMTQYVQRTDDNFVFVCDMCVIHVSHSIYVESNFLEVHSLLPPVFEEESLLLFLLLC